MRFTNITIPQGATVKAAYLTLRCNGDEAGTVVRTKIRGEDRDDAPTFLPATEGQNDWNARFPSGCTSAEVLWDEIPEWTPNSDYNSPDIAAVIQEIVNRPGWVSGNAIVIFWDDYDDRSTNATDCDRLAYSYDSSPTYCAKLHLEVESGGVTIDAGVAVATWDVMDVTLLSPKTLTPDPVSVEWSVPAVTLLSPKTLTPDPVIATWTIPAHMIEVVGANQTLKPDPVVATWDVPAPTLVPGTVSLTPDPVVATWSVPAPVVTGQVTVTPSPVSVTWTVPEPTVVAGAVTILASPVAVVWAVPSPVIIGAGVGTAYTYFGAISRLLNPNAYASGVTFYLEVIIKTSAVTVPVYAQVYNVTDGVVIAGSEITSTSTTPTRLRSGQFTLASGAKQYRVQFGGQPGGVYTCYGADLIVEAS
jgi:hypothetical protein